MRYSEEEEMRKMLHEQVHVTEENVRRLLTEDEIDSIIEIV